MSTDTNRVDERSRFRKRRVVAWVLTGIVALLLAIIAAQQLLNLGPVLPPETGSDTLLLYALSSLNFAAFLVFSFILLRSLLRLRRERRERQPGSRIQTKLLVYFVGLSLLPIAAMAAFSYLFLNRSIEKWMGRLPENVVERVQNQQREGLTILNRDLRETTTLLAGMIAEKPQSQWQTTLDHLVAAGEVTAVEIVSNNGEVIAHSQATVPDSQQGELDSLLQRARRSNNEEDESLANGKGFDVMAVPLQSSSRFLLVPFRRNDTDV
ncbi:MAG TPA: hypothetical protein VE863_14010, partial [Pyrinomonadaceae bacterium]|nr:hypothetical protein [Pyrinomonadaceae bacterium]